MQDEDLHAFPKLADAERLALWRQRGDDGGEGGEPPAIGIVHSHIFVHHMQRHRFCARTDDDRADVEGFPGVNDVFSRDDALGEDMPARCLADGVDHSRSAAFLRRDDRLAERKRHRDAAECGMAADIGSAQRVAAAGDEATGLIGGGTQHRRDFRRRPLHNQLDIAVLRAIAADGRLDHRLGGRRHADRAHVAGRMGADIADRINHLGAEDRRGQPAVQRRGFAVLADDQPGKLFAQCLLQELHRLHIIDALHFPGGGGGGGADRGCGGNPVVVLQFLDRDQLGLADIDGRKPEHPPVIGPAAAAGGIDGAALDGGFDVFLNQYASHRLSPASNPCPSRAQLRTARRRRARCRHCRPIRRHNGCGLPGRARRSSPPAPPWRSRPCHVRRRMPCADASRRRARRQPRAPKAALHRRASADCRTPDSVPRSSHHRRLPAFRHGRRASGRKPPCRRGFPHGRRSAAPLSTARHWRRSARSGIRRPSRRSGPASWQVRRRRCGCRAPAAKPPPAHPPAGPSASCRHGRLAPRR
ncbi:hypothetical protein RHECNPAF_850081 [Rhizobium etli CNPAF512]|nr:hypothetical protein RHECNPAF_850081 [Rhizobium etli CNPAF512]